ncbi:MAG: hypothetical protein HY703_09850, partial [Gemmatimonadetes bacterium]|nr:hypothetical protein [Gemmatimonadota bacterium]
ADPLEGVVVDRGALRLQVERELRGKLVQLREGLLLAAGQPADVGNLLLRGFPSFATYFRAILRLSGASAKLPTDEVIREGARLVTGPAEPFLRVWEARRQGSPLRLEVDDPVVSGYYALAERAADFVDRYQEERGS